MDWLKIIELSLKMEEMQKQTKQPQLATYCKVGYIILKDNMCRAISLVLILFYIINVGEDTIIDTVN